MSEWQDCFKQGVVVRLGAKVDLPKALRFLGHRGQDLSDISAKAEQAAETCNNELQASGVFRVFEIAAASETGVALEGTQLVLPGKDIAKRLDGCFAACCMAVTLGVRSDMLIRREQTLSAVEGMLVDACASSMVEVGAEDLNLLISDQAKLEELACTPRFSPGYGDMPLDCQGDFICSIGADRTLGISVNRSNFLVPRKSITAVIGLSR